MLSDFVSIFHFNVIILTIKMYFCIKITIIITIGMLETIKNANEKSAVMHELCTIMH